MTMTLAELAVALPDRPESLRFHSKLEEAPAPLPEMGPCLLWTRSTTNRGYGRFNDGSGRIVTAHSWLWRTLNGPVPEGLELHHFCHEHAVKLGTCAGGQDCVHRRCVIHVEPITHRENMLRGNTFQAEQAARDWCTGKYGPHDLRDPRNVYTPPGERRKHERHCRACNRERVREFRRKQADLRARTAKFGEQLTIV